jgi:hypothetical protein
MSILYFELLVNIFIFETRKKKLTNIT